MIEINLFNCVNRVFLLCPPLRKLFYEYLDALYVASTSKLKLNFLKECVKEKVLPRSLIPATILNVYNEPFPMPASVILKDRIRNVNHSTKFKFRVTNNCFNKLMELTRDMNLSDEIVSKFIDYAHAYIKDRTYNQKLNLNTKLRSIIKNSKWWTIGSPNFYVNLSSHALTENQRIILGYGPSFGISHKEDILDFITKYIDISKQFKEEWNADVIKGFILRNISTDKYNLPDCLLSALYELRKNENILITRADKGNKLVVMDKEIYINKINMLLADTSTYEPITNNPLKSAQREFNERLKLILIEFPELFKNVKSFLPKMAYFYGLPKVHKENYPLRPIISNIEYITYKLSKWLSKELKILVGNISRSHLTNSVDFIEKITNINFTGKNVVSYDVVSLFTNVPLNFTLELLEEFLNEENFTFSVPFTVIKELILLQNSIMFFEFDNRFFRQKFGLSMGAPLSPTLANIFMELIERKFILPTFNNMLWFRYVDDIFAVFPTEYDPLTILEYINNITPTIKFTMESPEFSSLPFLDVLIRINNDGRPRFRVYRKTTHTNSYVHWYSCHSDGIKNGILKGQFLRALNICSPEFLDEEIEMIKKNFKNLNYPIYFINKVLKDATTKFYRGQKEGDSSKKIYVSAPVELSASDSSLLPKDLCLVSSVKNIKSFFPSGKLKKPENNNRIDVAGIYKIKCKGCNKCYIGESDNISRRQYQHKYDLRIDNLGSPLVKHRNETGHVIDTLNLDTIITMNNIKKRKLLEMLIIKNTDNFNVMKEELRIDIITNNILKRDSTIKRLLKNELSPG